MKASRFLNDRVQRLSGGIIGLSAYPELGRRIKLSQRRALSATRVGGCCKGVAQLLRSAQ
jgi:hypothetical protein